MSESERGSHRTRTRLHFKMLQWLSSAGARCSALLIFSAEEPPRKHKIRVISRKARVHMAWKMAAGCTLQFVANVECKRLAGTCPYIIDIITIQQAGQTEIISFLRSPPGIMQDSEQRCKLRWTARPSLSSPRPHELEYLTRESMQMQVI